MSDDNKQLALFTLCKSLVELLGEEQAIADLTLLYKIYKFFVRQKIHKQFYKNTFL